MENQKRGCLSKRVKEASKKLLGYEITTPELRLMPYLVYVLSNEKIIDARRINIDELAILNDWMSEGWVVELKPKVSITKEFWDNIQELIYLAYIDLD